ncbi:MAG TPA: flagellar hook-associated protein FlgL [Syntrophomonadaceae bacterium]|nr:flagellar hook-associated protein FlgL [Syntrophomonadaceae bacterium]
MRVTNNMIVNDLRRNLNNNMRAMDNWNRQLSTTRKLNKPSDNPADLVKAMRLRTNLVEGEQYIRNIGEAINFMETTDAALNDISSILQRVRDLTVKAANGTNDDRARQAIADEIGELNKQIQMIANSTYGTKHIFAGTNVTEKPLQQDDSGKFIWKGNNEAFEMEIAVGAKFCMNLTNGGMQNFFMENDAPDDVATDKGIFGILTKLESDIRNVNNGDDLEKISQTLDALDEKIDVLLTARASIGARVNRLELQQNRLQDTKLSFTSLLSQAEDADMAEVIMQLKMQENVFRASLGAGARIIQPSLLDFLR